MLFSTLRASRLKNYSILILDTESFDTSNRIPYPSEHQSEYMRIKTHLQNFGKAVASLVALFYTLKIPSIATDFSLLLASTPAVAFASYLAINDTIGIGFNPPVPMYVFITFAWARIGTEQIKTDLSGLIPELLSTLLGIATGVVGFFFLVVLVEVIIYSVSGKEIDSIGNGERQGTDDAYGDPYAEEILDED